jgi:SSS family solute:Na+ symporter/sodium/pantothenate symporter
MSRRVLGDFWGPLLGGAVIAAPFAAIMSTVDSFLLMISSGLVRDIYQRNLNPVVSERTVKRLTYAITAQVGIGATLIALQPPRFLQYIIVFTGQGLACCLLAPIVLALFWRRSTGPGAMAAMLGGFLTFIVLYVVGWIGRGLEWLPPQTFGPRSDLAPYWLLGLEPLVWGLVVSVAAGIAVSLRTRPPQAELVERLFPPTSGAA